MSLSLHVSSSASFSHPACEDSNVKENDKRDSPAHRYEDIHSNTTTQIDCSEKLSYNNYTSKEGKRGELEL